MCATEEEAATARQRSLVIAAYHGEKLLNEVSEGVSAQKIRRQSGYETQSWIIKRGIELNKRDVCNIGSTNVVIIVAWLNTAVYRCGITNVHRYGCQEARNPQEGHPTLMYSQLTVNGGQGKRTHSV
jgi:hypothetical protein